MADIEAGKKEQAILSLSNRLLENIDDLGNRLDSAFDRVPKPTGEMKPGEPVVPNVLDEIIQNLEVANKHLCGRISFISREVLAKIH